MSPMDHADAPARHAVPEWAGELIAQYESNAANQFILYGNITDRMVLPLPGGPQLGSLSDFLLRVLMPRFDVILSYDIGNGLRVEQGGKVLAEWRRFKEQPELPKPPRAAVETLTHYFRYCANLAQMGRRRIQVGCFVRAAQLVAPALRGGFSYDLNALALLIRDWASDRYLARHALATFLITENLNDLHPLLVNNPRAARIKIPLPSPGDIEGAIRMMASRYPMALGQYGADLGAPARQFAGASLGAIESLLKTKEYHQQALVDDDLASLKKSLVENECNGLIEFIESKLTLDALYGQEKIKTWLRQDIALWRQNDLAAMPMGYLLCGPVGTGKTFMVKCLAGEAGVPVVKLKNFRDKWVGSTEGNLERIFRLLHALGRCYVFVDEADQALGSRESGTGDSGLSGRIYSMIAEEMSDTRNRGKIVWILASSRPDLIEVDLKRPGRVDVKIPLFPTTTPDEGFALIRALCRTRGLTLDPEHYDELKSLIPNLLTPGAAEALAVKVYRLAAVEKRPVLDTLKDCLTGYQHPIPPEIMGAQIALAVREASDMDFVPAVFQHLDA